MDDGGRDGIYHNRGIFAGLRDRGSAQPASPYTGDRRRRFDRGFALQQIRGKKRYYSIFKRDGLDVVSSRGFLYGYKDNNDDVV